MRVRVEFTGEVVNSDDTQFAVTSPKGVEGWFDRELCTILSDPIEEGTMVLGWNGEEDKDPRGQVIGRYFGHLNRSHEIIQPDGTCVIRNHVHVIAPEELTK